MLTRPQLNQPSQCGAQIANQQTAGDETWWQEVWCEQASSLRGGIDWEGMRAAVCTRGPAEENAGRCPGTRFKEVRRIRQELHDHLDLLLDLHVRGAVDLPRTALPFSVDRRR